MRMQAGHGAEVSANGVSGDGLLQFDLEAVLRSSLSMLEIEEALLTSHAAFADAR